MSDARGASKEYFAFRSRATGELLQMRDRGTEAGAELVQPGRGEASNFRMVFSPASAEPTPSGTDAGQRDREASPGQEARTEPAPSGTEPGQQHREAGAGRETRTDSGTTPSGTDGTDGTDQPAPLRNGTQCVTLPGEGRDGVVPVASACTRSLLGQLWRKRPTPGRSGVFSLRSAQGGTCLEAAADNGATLRSVRMRPCREGSEAQMWQAVRSSTAAGTTHWRSVRTELHLHVNGAGRRAIVVQKPYEDGPRQRFTHGG